MIEKGKGKSLSHRLGKSVVCNVGVTRLVFNDILRSILILKEYVCH